VSSQFRSLKFHNHPVFHNKDNATKSNQAPYSTYIYSPYETLQPNKNISSPLLA